MGPWCAGRARMVHGEDGADGGCANLGGLIRIVLNRSIILGEPRRVHERRLPPQAGCVIHQRDFNV